jgi:hypothetical protein
MTYEQLKALKPRHFKRACGAYPQTSGRVPSGCGSCFETASKPSASCESAGHQLSQRVFDPSFTPLGLLAGTPELSMPRLGTDPWLTHSAAAAPVAPATGALHEATRRAPSVRPPWLAYTVATAWLSPGHGWAREAATAAVNSRGARHSGDRSGTTRVAAASPLHPGRAC